MIYSEEERALNPYCWIVQVQTKDHLDFWIKDYFNGLEVDHNPDGSSLISGELPDLPALYGLFIKLRDSGVVILSMQVRRTNC